MDQAEEIKSTLQRELREEWPQKGSEGEAGGKKIEHLPARTSQREPGGMPGSANLVPGTQGVDVTKA